MAELDHPKISVKRQAELLNVNRTSLYREVQAHQEREENIQIMHAIDAIYTDMPFFGYRRITAKLRERGFVMTCLKWRSPEPFGITVMGNQIERRIRHYEK